MGFVKAFSGSMKGTFADQWKDFYVPMPDIPYTAAVYRAEFHLSDPQNSSNTKSSPNILTNGSKIIVPEGNALLTIQDGAITGCIAEPGGYIFNSEDQNSQSLFAGDGVMSSTLKTSWERFTFGGSPASEQLAFYVNLKEIPGNRFGTQSSIYWHDAYLNAQVGAKTRGTYSLKIVDPILLVKNLVPIKYFRPNSEAFTLDYQEGKIGEQLFNEIVGCLSAAFSDYTNADDKHNRIFKIQSDQVGFAKSLAQSVEDAYHWQTDRGITIAKVVVAAIEYDQATQKLLDDVNKAEALDGNRGSSFMKQAIARGFQSAGSNGGGADVAFMGLGLNAISNLTNSDAVSNPNNTNGNVKADDINLYDILSQLKKLLDDKIITEDEFKQAKHKILGVK